MLIYWGGRQTRRTEQVTERLRMALEMDPENKEEPGDESASGSGTGTGPGPRREQWPVATPNHRRLDGPL